MALSDLPVVQKTRTRILRQARMGTRPAPTERSMVDAFDSVQSVGRTIESFKAQTTSTPFFGALYNAWLARH